LTNPFLDGGIGLLVGLLLAAGLAFLLAHIDQRIRSRAMVELSFSAPVLVEVPRQRLTGKARDIVVTSAAASAAAEAYRVLRTVLTYGVAAELPWTAWQSVGGSNENGAVAPSAQIEAGDVAVASGAGDSPSADVGAKPSALAATHSKGRRPARGGRSSRRSRVIVVTAATDERIRPTAVANLAASYAEANQDVIVVRIDAGLPRDEVSFSEQAPARPQDAVRPSALPRVATLDLATLRDAGVVNGRSEADLIGDIVPLADITLVEAAPVLEAHDVGVLSSVADDVLIVAEYGHTTRGAAERCAVMLARMGTTPRGVVFTQVPARRGPLRFRRSGGVRSFSWGAIEAARPN
jgi:Mrp family chromosome partitioning ATPase